MNTVETAILYIFVFVLSTFFMYLAQKNVKLADGTKKRIFDVFWFLLAFVPLWITMCFTNIGADYESYIDIITNARQIRYENGIVEWVFYSLCIVLFDVFRNAHIVIFIIKTVTLFLFFCAIYMLRKEAVLWLSLLAFCGLRFLEFYLIQMQLSVSIFMIGLIFLLRNKPLRFLICYILSALIHSSALIFFPVFLLFFALKGQVRTFNREVIISICIICLIILSAWLSISVYAVKYIPFFQQYAYYSLISDYAGSGITVYIYYLPVIYFCIFIYKSCKYWPQYTNIAVILTLFCFVFGILGYKIEVLGRLRAYALALQMIIIPIYFCKRRSDSSRKALFSRRTENILWLLFLLFQSSLFFIEKMTSPTSMVSAWRFDNPFF